MMSTFKVGQKVACVNADWLSWFGAPPLVKGQVYTVVATENTRSGTIFREHLATRPVVVLAEVKNAAGCDTLGFDARRFRAVTYPRKSIEHDTELFLPLLTKRELVE
jgi:hypothetical protein